jgi:hypothetical protein
MTYLLLFLGVLYFSLFVISFFKVRSNGEEFSFIYPWAFWVGAFVWEDLMIFAALHAIFVLITYLAHDLRYGLLMIGIFWIVRSTGETIYFFLQQFFMPNHHPHYLHPHFEQMKRVFGNISDQKGYILMQMTHQSVVILAAISVALLCLNWQSITAWF